MSQRDQCGAQKNPTRGLMKSFSGIHGIRICFVSLFCSLSLFFFFFFFLSANQCPVDSGSWYLKLVMREGGLGKAGAKDAYRGAKANLVLTSSAACGVFTVILKAQSGEVHRWIGFSNSCVRGSHLINTEWRLSNLPDKGPLHCLSVYPPRGLWLTHIQ